MSLAGCGCKVLKLADLQPTERAPFELADGTLIYFVNRLDLNATQTAAVQRAQHQANLANRLARKATSSEEQEKAGNKLAQASHNMVHVILPDLPDAVLDGLTVGQLEIIIDHWAKLNTPPEGN